MPRKEPMEKYAERRAKELKARADDRRAGPAPLNGRKPDFNKPRPQAWVDRSK